MSETTEKRSRISQVGRWLAELVLVFVGVYAAFWLNNYQQRQQEAKRHDQILALLEQRLKVDIESAKTGEAKVEGQVAEFQRALKTGEMPTVRPFNFSNDYNASDIATLLQAGGIELLDMKTLTALREFESVIRGGLSRITHFQNLSDELIVPNLDQDISFFYDPATKKLRKRFEQYPDALQTVATFLHDLEKAQTNLLTQIQAERQRH
jgi:microcompartment protein CcmL/EutN